MIGPSPYSLFPAHQFKAIFNLLRAHLLFPDVCGGKRQLSWVPGGQQGLPWALGAGAGLCSLGVSVQGPGPAVVPTPVTETLWCGLRLGTFRLWSQGRPGLTGLGGGSLARCSGQECSLPRTLTPRSLSPTSPSTRTCQECQVTYHPFSGAGEAPQGSLGASGDVCA